MKFYETRLEEVAKVSLHPKCQKHLSRLPPTLERMPNLVFYGPSGVGKYTQMLLAIRRYSPSDLKYEKQLSLGYDKRQYFFKISDIHVEIDMGLLGCNSKLCWHDFYQQLVDIISAKPNKIGIVVCKNFHLIHSELLDNFYSYMQDNQVLPVTIKYILLTESVSFLPDSILNSCVVLSLARPSRTAYSKVLKRKLPPTLALENIVNIKYLFSGISPRMHCPHQLICDRIWKNMVSLDFSYSQFRDLLYEIFISHLEVANCIGYILGRLPPLTVKQHTDVAIHTFTFFKYYNNNYRPIYHLESYLLYLTKVIHGW